MEELTSMKPLVTESVETEEHPQLTSEALADHI